MFISMLQNKILEQFSWAPAFRFILVWKQDRERIWIKLSYQLLSRSGTLIDVCVEYWNRCTSHMLIRSLSWGRVGKLKVVSLSSYQKLPLDFSKYLDMPLDYF